MNWYDRNAKVMTQCEEVSRIVDLCKGLAGLERQRKLLDELRPLGNDRETIQQMVLDRLVRLDLRKPC